MPTVTNHLLRAARSSLLLLLCLSCQDRLSWMPLGSRLHWLAITGWYWWARRSCKAALNLAKLEAVATLLDVVVDVGRYIIKLQPLTIALDGAPGPLEGACKPQHSSQLLRNFLPILALSYTPNLLFLVLSDLVRHCPSLQLQLEHHDPDSDGSISSGKTAMDTPCGSPGSPQLEPASPLDGKAAHHVDGMRQPKHACCPGSSWLSNTSMTPSSTGTVCAVVEASHPMSTEQQADSSSSPKAAGGDSEVPGGAAGTASKLPSTTHEKPQRHVRHSSTAHVDLSKVLEGIMQTRKAGASTTPSSQPAGTSCLYRSPTAMATAAIKIRGAADSPTQFQCIAPKLHGALQVVLRRQEPSWRIVDQVISRGCIEVLLVLAAMGRPIPQLGQAAEPAQEPRQRSSSRASQPAAPERHGDIATGSGASTSSTPASSQAAVLSLPQAVESAVHQALGPQHGAGLAASVLAHNRTMPTSAFARHSGSPLGGISRYRADTSSLPTPELSDLEARLQEYAAQSGALHVSDSALLTREHLLLPLDAAISAPLAAEVGASDAHRLHRKQCEQEQAAAVAAPPRPQPLLLRPLMPGLVLPAPPEAPDKAIKLHLIISGPSVTASAAPTPLQHPAAPHDPPQPLPATLLVMQGGVTVHRQPLTVDTAVLQPGAEPQVVPVCLDALYLTPGIATCLVVFEHVSARDEMSPEGPPSSPGPTEQPVFQMLGACPVPCFQPPAAAELSRLWEAMAHEFAADMYVVVPATAEHDVATAATRHGVAPPPPPPPPQAAPTTATAAEQHTEQTQPGGGVPAGAGGGGNGAARTCTGQHQQAVRHMIAVPLLSNLVWCHSFSPLLTDVQLLMAGPGEAVTSLSLPTTPESSGKETVHPSASATASWVSDTPNTNSTVTDWQETVQHLLMFMAQHGLVNVMREVLQSASMAVTLGGDDLRSNPQALEHLVQRLMHTSQPHDLAAAITSAAAAPASPSIAAIRGPRSAPEILISLPHTFDLHEPGMCTSEAGFTSEPTMRAVQLLSSSLWDRGFEDWGGDTSPAGTHSGRGYMTAASSFKSISSDDSLPAFSRLLDVSFNSERERDLEEVVGGALLRSRTR